MRNPLRLRRRTALADASPDRDQREEGRLGRVGPPVAFWTVAGALVVAAGGWPLLLLWLTPGVPPPGPLW